MASAKTEGFLGRILRPIRQAFCNHSTTLTFVRNAGAEESASLGGARAIWRCDRCGAPILGNEPQRVPERGTMIMSADRRTMLVKTTDEDGGGDAPPNR